MLHSQIIEKIADNTNCVSNIDLVHTITYIRLPTTEEYGTLEMFSFISLAIGHIFLLNFI